MKQVLDETGMIIHPRDILKVFHFIGARRKKHYMYKWVILKDGELYAQHSGKLEPHEDGYWLWPQMHKDGRIKGTEILSRE